MIVGPYLPNPVTKKCSKIDFSLEVFLKSTFSERTVENSLLNTGIGIGIYRVEAALIEKES